MSRFPVSIKAVLIDANRRVVLLKNDRAEWELPGGKLEAGEQPPAVVEREITEELGISARCGPILDSWVFEVLPRQEVLIITYAATGGALDELQLSAEHEAVGLFTLTEAEQLPIPPGYLASIRRWLDHPQFPA